MSDHRTVSRGLDQALFVVSCLLLVVANVSIAVSQISLGVALALWTTWHVAAGRRPAGLGLIAPAAALAIWALGMIPLSTDPGQSLQFFRRFYIFAALWIGASVAVSEKRRGLLLACLLAGALVVSSWGQLRMFVATGSLFSRRLGEMSNPMTSGALLMMVLLVAIGAGLQPRLGRRVRLVVLAVALPILLGLLQTLTRSAWLGLAVGGLVMLLLSRPRLVPVTVVTLIVLGTALLAVPDEKLPRRLSRRLSADEFTGGKSTSRRMEMWTGGWRMVRERPLTGVGDRDLAAVCPRYYGDETTRYHGHLHSNPVMFAAIWGVPGFVLAMVFIGAQLLALLRRWRSLQAVGARAPPWAAAWCLGAIGVWAGIFVAGLFEWYFGDAETLLLNLAVVGIGLGGTPVDAGEGEAHV